MSVVDKITKEELDSLFTYNPLTGDLIRKRTGKQVVYSEFDSVPKVSFKLNGKNHRMPVHSIVWCLYYGDWCKELIFHKDFNQFNLKINNLMQVNNKTNYALISAYKNLTQYCDIKPHSQDKHIYLVRYLCNNRLRYERYMDMKFAQQACMRLIRIYRRVIIKLGAIPPC